MREKQRAVFLILAVGVLAVALCRESAAAPGSDAAPLRAEAQRFVEAYPGAGLGVQSGPDGLYITVGAASLLFSPWNGCPAVRPDADPGDAPLCAMLAQPYPMGDGGRHPAPGFDPGRVRNEAFLQALYGASAGEVEKSLVPVSFLGETWRFSSRQGAAAALRRVAAILEKAAADDPALAAYILPGGGTYAWRKIKDSPRLSAHSFGICIDLNIEKGLYWLWHPAPDRVAKTRRDYPQAIVDAFESEGFIWGGKWHSFDFMHFEYRPELAR